MDSWSGDAASSSESEAREWKEDWERIRREATKFPNVYREDLEAELAASLVVWKRRYRARARDWKAYLGKALHHRALTLIEQWRQRDKPLAELSAEQDLPASTETATDEDAGFSNTSQNLVALQRRLGNSDRHLLKQLRDCDGNVSRLARRIRQHRNTIHRRLRKIREKCPIEIESAATIPGQTDPSERAALEAAMQSPLSSKREILRTRVLLALRDGLTYNEITKTFRVSSATILRCRQRWLRQGIRGLQDNDQPGRAPSRARLHFVKWLLQQRSPQKYSIRLLARQFRLAKSTVQRILSLRRSWCN